MEPKRLERSAMMVKDILAVEISNMPDLLHLAEDVQRTHIPRLLQRNGQAIALLLPIASPPLRSRQHQLTPSEADPEAFRQAAGSWQDVDTDQLLEDIQESRRRSVSPSVEL
jgi:hypothetical protein